MECEIIKYKKRFIIFIAPEGEPQSEIELIFPSSKVNIYFEGKESFSGEEMKETINKSVLYCLEHIPTKYAKERSDEICNTLEQFMQEITEKIENKTYLLKRITVNCSCRQEITNL